MHKAKEAMAALHNSSSKVKTSADRSSQMEKQALQYQQDTTLLRQHQKLTATQREQYDLERAQRTSDSEHRVAARRNQLEQDQLRRDQLKASILSAKPVTLQPVDNDRNRSITAPDIATPLIESSDATLSKYWCCCNGSASYRSLGDSNHGHSDAVYSPPTGGSGNTPSVTQASIDEVPDFSQFFSE